jgi:hypothetical protein
MKREMEVGLSENVWEEAGLIVIDDLLAVPPVARRKRDRQESSASPQWDGGAWRQKGKGKRKEKERDKDKSGLERASNTPNLDGTGLRSRRGCPVWRKEQGEGDS